LAQQLLQLFLVHPPQPEEVVPPPEEPLPVRKSEIIFFASLPQAGQGKLFCILLQSSSYFLLQSEQKNSYIGKTAPPRFY